MPRTENYSWRTWTQNCAMVAYITDTSHLPQQWQEEYKEGPAYEAAVAIVKADKENAEVVGYTQTTINEEHRVYLRKNNETGNAWEVKLDDNANEIPAPCATPPPAPPSGGGDPRDFIYTLTNVTIAGEYLQIGPATRLKVTMIGFLSQA